MAVADSQASPTSGIWWSPFTRRSGGAGVERWKSQGVMTHPMTQWRNPNKQIPTYNLNGKWLVDGYGNRIHSSWMGSSNPMNLRVLCWCEGGAGPWPGDGWIAGNLLSYEQGWVTLTNFDCCNLRLRFKPDCNWVFNVAFISRSAIINKHDLLGAVSGNAWWSIIMASIHRKFSATNENKWYDMRTICALFQLDVHIVAKQRA